ncbi:hypothetical protein MO867_21890, partial [Microbulbifer sp. OS29]
MKFYGYTKQEAEKENPKPLELSEVTISASAEELRKLAKFIAEQSIAIEKDQDGYEHEHLSDSCP